MFIEAFSPEFKIEFNSLALLLLWTKEYSNFYDYQLFNYYPPLN